jgi:hypothetical protein
VISLNATAAASVIYSMTEAHMDHPNRVKKLASSRAVLSFKAAIAALAIVGSPTGCAYP